jgi:hypothetical protein
MKNRRLGRLEVSEMGFGCMSISANYGPAAVNTCAGLDGRFFMFWEDCERLIASRGRSPCSQISTLT